MNNTNLVLLEDFLDRNSLFSVSLSDSEETVSVKKERKKLFKANLTK